jgi:hypothetical protein
MEGSHRNLMFKRFASAALAREGKGSRRFTRLDEVDAPSRASGDEQ